MRRTGPTLETEDAVLNRCDGACEVCSSLLDGERGLGWALHHRRGRDGKPDSHAAPNLLAVCGASNVAACHGRIHRNADQESRVNGWLITRNGINRDPLLIPALIGDRWVYLTADGRYKQAPVAV